MCCTKKELVFSEDPWRTIQETENCMGNIELAKDQYQWKAIMLRHKTAYGLNNLNGTVYLLVLNVIFVVELSEITGKVSCLR